MIISGNEKRKGVVTYEAKGTINLSKGAKINLTKDKPSLKNIMIGLGWDCNKYSGSCDFDLDASVFLVDASGRTKAEGFVFYNNLVGPNESVVHQGDNRTGEGEGDDEQIMVCLDKIPDYVEKIAITVTIDAATERKQNFGMVENAFCRLVNDDTGVEEVRFDLAEEFSIETAIVVGEIYKYNGSWQFRAIGQGFSGGLQALCKNYGLDAEYM